MYNKLLDGGYLAESQVIEKIFWINTFSIEKYDIENVNDRNVM